MRILPPELSHSLVLFLLNYPMLFKKNKYSSQLLKTNLFGKILSNPIGLAAGFDKNATALPSLIKLGFSFIEVGTVTPKAQIGNLKPRVFRLKKNKAIINRLGFPNIGIEKIKINIASIRNIHPIGTEPLIGINIGYNKQSTNPLNDYLECLNKLAHLADYITVNVSSPNTPGLRNYESSEKIYRLLNSINKARKKKEKELKRSIPLVLKISPDLNTSNLAVIVDCTRKNNFEAIAISNTTLNREILINEKNSHQLGGISGAPLHKISTVLQSKLYKITKGYPKIIGIGGIDHAEKAIEKIQKGADAIQVYTGLTLKGINLVNDILIKTTKFLNNNNLNSLKSLRKMDNKK